MKKVLLLLVLVTAAASRLSAQQFVTGTNMISAGIGLGSSLGSFSYGSQSPALSLQYERGIWDIAGPGVISLGAYVGRKSFKYSFSGYTEKWGYTVIGVRSAYHYNGIHSDKLDVYGGLMLAYNILHYSYKDSQGNHFGGSGNYGSTAGLSLFAGGRYFFSSQVAAFAEIGYGVSYLTLGIGFKF
jgi:hypothetical protein